jgi:hypothetical protein
MSANKIIPQERLEQKRREKLDPEGLFLSAQFEHSTELYHRRQKANYEEIEINRSDWRRDERNKAK